MNDTMKMLHELSHLCDLLVAEYPPELENNEDLYLLIFNLKLKLDEEL